MILEGLMADKRRETWDGVEWVQLEVYECVRVCILEDGERLNVGIELVF